MTYRLLLHVHTSVSTTAGRHNTDAIASLSSVRVLPGEVEYLAFRRDEQVHAACSSIAW